MIEAILVQCGLIDIHILKRKDGKWECTNIVKKPLDIFEEL